MPGERSPGGGSSIFGRISARSSIFSSKDVKCSVQLLDDSDTISNEFKRSDTAQTILDYVCELRGIQEKDYFGLRYQDHNKHRYWLDLSRPISHVAKQFKSDNLALRLRFRFYPTNPSHLRDPVTKYQLFVQLRRDLLHGRLYCPQTRSAELAALILQTELGDYDAEVRPSNYVSEYKLLLRQTQKTEDRIAEYHKALKGKSFEEAESAFLQKASLLDTYGFDPYTVKDPKDSTTAVYLGVSHKGILIYQVSQKLHHITWNKLEKVDYVSRELRITPKDNYEPPPAAPGMTNGLEASPTKKKDHPRYQLKYLCPSGNFAKHLWTHILSQQAFFNEDSSKHIKPKFSKPRIPLLTRGSTFRFPGKKVEKEIEETPLSDESVLLSTSLLALDPNTSAISADSPSNDTNVFDASIMTSRSSTIKRYHLPHQVGFKPEPRQPSPWLNGNATEHSQETRAYPSLRELNKNDGRTKPIDMNGGPNMESPLDPTNTPVGSHQLAGSPSSPMSINSERSLEAAQQLSSTPLEGNHISTVSFSAISQIDKDKEHVPEPQKIGNGDRREEKTMEQALGLSSESVFKSNGRPNGGTNMNGHANGKTGVVSSGTSSERGSKIANVVFVTLLIFILFIFLLIALFERHGDADYVESWPWLASLRHHYYEPARHFTLKQYGKYFRK
ncbi:hypothetical protein WR25_09305 [Diploscapter pachys]|uniref:FERM domain-containing protein n=1 Tax=Diploscapter pachys TaxID=2018661 RepID=A0A2A2L534_9BILA|nr:hypothetical protein WR25_09305 [Diploscapter pachys]